MKKEEDDQFKTVMVMKKPRGKDTIKVVDYSKTFNTPIKEKSTKNNVYYFIGISTIFLIIQTIIGISGHLMAFIFLFLNLGVIAVLGEYLMESAEKLSVKLNISPFIIGLVLIPAFSSLPEDVVTVSMNLKDPSLGEIIFGQILVNNLFELLVIFGLTGILVCTFTNKCIEVEKKDRILIVRNGVILILSSLLLFFLVFFDGNLSFTDGIVLFMFYGVFIFILILTNKFGIKEQENIIKEINPEGENINGLKEFGLIVGLIILILFFSDAFANDTIFLIKENAHFQRYSFIYIGIILAIPELIITIVGFIKDKVDVTLGMVMGGAIYGLLISIGVQAVVNPLNNISEVIIMILIISTMVGMITAVIYIRTEWTLKKWEGLLMMSTFIIIFIILILYYNI
ncbi:MAG: sodium:calcium antiporter [Promethearchaeota archaeon]